MVPPATIQNNSTIHLKEIPVLAYEDFLETNVNLIRDETHHCVSYFGFRYRNNIRLICCIANDKDATVLIMNPEVLKISRRLQLGISVFNSLNGSYTKALGYPITIIPG
jgi:hypothetical protein